MSQPEQLDYSAVLDDGMSPVFDEIASSVGDLSSVVEDMAATVGEALDAAAASADSLSASLDTTTGATDMASASAEALAAAEDNVAASLDTTATALAANTAETDTNTASTKANTGAKNKNAASSKGMGDAIGAINTPIMLASGGLLALGAAAMNAGDQFETAMSVVQGLADNNAKDIQSFTNQILTDAPKWGIAPTQLANGLYYVLSAGVKAKDAMSVLQVVSEASAAGLVDAATDADALTTALNSYGASSKQAMLYQDILITAVKDGKQMMADLARSFGKAASMASVAGVSIQMAAAAESTLTLSGLSARMANMDLAALIQDLDLKTDALAKRASKLGIAFDENKFKTMNLYQQLQYLETVTGGSSTKLNALINNSPAFQAAVKLMTDKGAAFKNIIADMGNASGRTANAFKVHEQTMGASLDKLKAAADVTFIKIQQALKPLVESIVNKVVPALERFASWVSTHGAEVREIFKAIAGVFTGTLVIAVMGFAGKAVDALGKVGKHFSFLFDSVGKDSEKVPGLLSKVGTSFQDLWTKGSGIFGNLVQGIKGFGLGAKQFLDGVPGLIERGMGALSRFGSKLGDAMDFISGDAIPNFLGSLTKGSTYINLFKGIGSGLFGVLQGGLPVLGSLAGSFLAVLGPVLLIAGAIAIGVLIFTSFRKQAMDVVNTLFGALKPAIDSIKQTFGAFIGGIKSAIAAAWPAIHSAMMGLFTALKNLKPVVEIVGFVISAVFKVVMTVLGWVVKAFIGALPGIIGFFTGIFQIIGKFGELIKDIFTLQFGKIPGVIGGIIGGIWHAITSGFGAILGFIGNFIGNILGWFAHLFEKLIGHSIVPDLISGVVNFFLSLPGKILGMLPGLIGNIVGWFLQLPGKILGMLPGLLKSLVGWFASLPGKLLGALGGLVGGIVHGIGNLVGGVIHGIGNVVGGIGHMAVEGAKAVVGMAVKGVQAVGHMAVEGAKKFAGFVGNVAKGAAHLAVEGVKKLASFAVEGAKYVASMAVNGAKHFAGMVGSVISGGAHMVANVVGNIGHMAIAGVQHFGEMTKGAIDHVAKMNIPVVSGIAGMASKGLSAVGNMWHGVVNFFQSGANRAADIAAIQRDKVAMTMIQQRDRVLAAHIQQAMFSVMAMERERDGTLAALASCKDGAEKHALEMKLAVENAAIAQEKKVVAEGMLQHDKYVAQMKKLKEDSEKHTKDMSNNIWSNIASLPGKFLSAAGGMIGNLAGGIKNGIGNVVGGVGNLVHGMLGGLGNLAGGALKAAGNMMSGLLNGIKNGIGNVLGGIGNACHNVLSSIGNIFGIHSPSTVFHSIGMNLMLGLSNGINAHASKPLLAARSAAGAVLSSMNDLLSGATSIGGGVGAHISGIAATIGANAAPHAGGGERHLHVHLDSSIMLLNPQTRRTLVNDLSSDFADEWGKQGSLQQIMHYGITGGMH